ncbi:MAG TPA: hypothetical protein VED16_04950 [Candidatus Acidoferrum sp.]|nr:hypothetical protein [Candidatus Acidoferrum sp.]
MSESCKYKADAHQTRQPIVTQFLVALMVTIMLVTPLVTRCAGGVANPASYSPTTPTTLKTPKVSPTQPLATTPVHSVAVLNGNSSRGDPITGSVIALILAAFITASGAIIAALIGAGALITAPLLNGAIPAAMINGGSLIAAYVIFGLIGLIPHPAPVPVPLTR